MDLSVNPFMLYLKNVKKMIRLKKNFFFIKYFYRWPTIGLCILLGIVTLLFYDNALQEVLEYPSWFPIGMFIVNVLLLIVVTVLMTSPIKFETKLKSHRFAMFILLIVNPSLAVGLSQNFLSILWTLHISTYLLYCLLFIQYKKFDWLVAGIPFATFLVHALYKALTTGVPANVEFLMLFGFLMSIFYFMFYVFYKFTLDNTQESLSVYLENSDISNFLSEYKLTKREKEICICIINGLSAKEIAKRFLIYEGTVKTHTKNIYRKMGISGRMELMHLIWDFSLLKLN